MDVTEYVMKRWNNKLLILMVVIAPILFRVPSLVTEHYRIKRVAQALKQYDQSAALASAGHYKEAIPGFTDVIKVMPDFTPAHSQLADCLFEVGDNEGAKREYQIVIQSDPVTHRSVYYYLGNIAAKQGNIKEARHDWKMVQSMPAEFLAEKEMVRMASEKLAQYPK